MISPRQKTELHILSKELIETIKNRYDHFEEELTDMASCRVKEILGYLPRNFVVDTFVNNHLIQRAMDNNPDRDNFKDWEGQPRVEDLSEHIEEDGDEE